MHSQGSQALDAYEGVMPLSNSMAGVAQGHRDLQQLLLRARSESLSRPSCLICPALHTVSLLPPVFPVSSVLLSSVCPLSPLCALTPLFGSAYR